MRNWHRRTTLAVMLAGLLVSSGLAGANSDEISGPAPDFTLVDRNGKAVSLSDLKGQVVLINFWATWCGPCRKEMPLLEQLYSRYEPLGFTLLGVNVEEGDVNAAAFLEETPVSFPILFDPQNQVSKLYDVSAMPSTVLVDRNGNMRFLHHGYQDGYENIYQDQIRQLVRERG